MWQACLAIMTRQTMQPFSYGAREFLHSMVITCRRANTSGAPGTQRSAKAYPCPLQGVVRPTPINTSKRCFLFSPVDISTRMLACCHIYSAVYVRQYTNVGRGDKIGSRSRLEVVFCGGLKVYQGVVLSTGAPARWALRYFVRVARTTPLFWSKFSI